MKLATFLPVLAMLGLSGCVTGYGYSDDGYYYGRPSASAGSYGSIGYGSGGGWRYGYGMGYGYPGYYGYRDPYSGYYYDPYYGYYFPRPPVVIVRPPPGHGHGDNDHDDDDHDGRRPPPWRDLNDLGNRGPKPARAPDAAGGSPRQLWKPPAGQDPGNASRQPDRMRLPDPTPPRPSRIDSPRPNTVAPAVPRTDEDVPMRNGDRRR